MGGGGSTLTPLLLGCWGREWKQQVPLSPPQHYTVTLCLRAVPRTSRTQTQVAVISALSPFVAPDQTARLQETELRARHYTRSEMEVPSLFISLNSPASIMPANREGFI